MDAVIVSLEEAASQSSSSSSSYRGVVCVLSLPRALCRAFALMWREAALEMPSFFFPHKCTRGHTRG